MGRPVFRSHPIPPSSSAHAQASMALAEALIEVGAGTVDALVQAFDRQGDQTPIEADGTEGSRPMARGASLATLSARRGWAADSGPRSGQVVDQVPKLVASSRGGVSGQAGAGWRHAAALPAAGLEFSAGEAEDFEQALRRVGQVVNWGDGIAAMRHIGAGQSGVDVVAAGLVLCAPLPRRVTSARSGGRPIVAAPAAPWPVSPGAVLGARLGLDAIPAAWQARCASAAALVDLGARLAAARVAMEADRGG